MTHTKTWYDSESIQLVLMNRRTNREERSEPNLGLIISCYNNNEMIYGHPSLSCCFSTVTCVWTERLTYGWTLTSCSLVISFFSLTMYSIFCLWFWWPRSLPFSSARWSTCFLNTSTSCCGKSSTGMSQTHAHVGVFLCSIEHNLFRSSALPLEEARLFSTVQEQ